MTPNKFDPKKLFARPNLIRAAVLVAAYLVGLGTPAATEQLTALSDRPIPPTVTKVARVTATLTPTAKSVTNTPVPVVTLTPTKAGVTVTVVLPTNTPGVSATPTDPGAPILADDGCLITNFWKPPRNEVCGHVIMGHNPSDPYIIDLFNTYGTPGEYERWLDEYGEMWKPWTSSEAEIKHHWRGFVVLFTENLNCDQVASLNNDFSGEACIVWSVDVVHDDGLAEHSFSSKHSLTTHRIVCEKDLLTGKPIVSKATCGDMHSGMSQGDVDQLQTPYKTTWCDTPADNPFWNPFNFPDVLDGGIYHSHAIQDSDNGRNGPLMTGWWFQRPTVKEQAMTDAQGNHPYSYGPNTTFTTTFISQAWQKFQTYICAWTNNPVLATMAGYDLTKMTLLDAMKLETHKWPVSPDGGHNLWQVLNLRVSAFNQVPFKGWTNQYGQIYPPGEPDGGCTVPSFYCIPLSVGGNYPVGKPALLQRRFPGADVLKCENAPCLVFPTNGVEIIFPYDDHP